MSPEHMLGPKSGGFVHFECCVHFQAFLFSSRSFAFYFSFFLLGLKTTRVGFQCHRIGGHSELKTIIQKTSSTRTFPSATSSSVVPRTPARSDLAPTLSLSLSTLVCSSLFQHQFFPSRRTLLGNLKGARLCLACGRVSCFLVFFLSVSLSFALFSSSLLSPSLSSFLSLKPLLHVSNTPHSIHEMQRITQRRA